VRRARATFDVLSGDIHSSVRGALFEDGRTLRDAAIDRLRAGQAGPWGEVYGTDAQGKVGDGFGADSEQQSGLTYGADVREGDWQFGVQAGFSDTPVRMSSRGSDASINGDEVGYYVGGPAGPIRLSGGMIFGRQRIHTTRVVALSGLNQNLTARYDAHTTQSFAEAALPLDKNTIRFEPFANIAWETVDTDAFSENGGSAGIKSADHQTGATYYNLGLRSSRDFNWQGSGLTPQGSLAWRHGDDVEDSTLTTLQFVSGGSSFVVGGPVRDENAAAVGLNLTGKLGKSGRLSLSYEGLISEHYSSNGGSLALAWSF
jgi:outer membrane autotransporter protein